MKPKQSERAERCLKYFGDIFGIRTKAAMDKKFRQVNARATAMEKGKDNANKRTEKEALRIQRKIKKEADRNYEPHH